MEYLSGSKNETFRIAALVAGGLKAGDILVLSGDLGSGKTTFVQGLALALGISDQITSPTFVLMKEYQVKNEKVKKLIHVDAYRMQSENDAEAIGLKEYIQRRDSLIVVEWPENIIKIFPYGKKMIEFEYIDENRRKITVK